jgi:type I restriction enzyme S subunit
MYAQTKEPWIGFSPNDWSLKRVKFESYVKARVGWHGLKSDDFTDEGPYLVTGSDFVGKNIMWDTCYHCDEERYNQDPYIQLRNGDLLITKDGTIGKLALVQNLDGKATLNSGVFVVRPLRENYRTQYYYWLLQSAVFTGFVDFNKTGSTIVHLYQDTFENFKYASPSLSEQERIANFLDYETAKIDTLIDKQQQLIKLLKEKRQAVISHAVTKGLNPDAPMKDSGVEWVGEVPAHWVVKPLRHVGQCQNGINIGAEYFGSGFPFVSYGDVYNNRALPREVMGLVRSNEDDHKVYSVIEGDVFFTRTSETIEEIGFSSVCLQAIDNAAFAGFLIRFRPSRNELYKQYSKYLFQNILLRAFFVKEMNLVTRASLSQDLLKKMPVFLPPLEEQRAIADFLDDKVSKIELLIEKGTNTIGLIQERRTALISAAVTGKIDVRNWQSPKSDVPEENAA